MTKGYFMINGMNSLKDIKYISLALENCEGFDIEAKYILDIWFDEIHMGVGYNPKNKVYDGRLVLSKDCLDLLSSVAYVEFVDGTTGLDVYDKDTLKLRNRLLNCCDITQVHIYFNDGSRVWFFVPYDPLEDEIHGREIDLSNCSSAEFDENGNVLILFGKSSHSYNRVDNNYEDLILGFRDEITNKITKPLKVKIEEISNTESDYRCPRLFVDVRVQDKAYRNKNLKLVFEDIKDLTLEINTDALQKTVELMSSRISTGDIFVEFGTELNFYCQCIKTYSAFCNDENNVRIADCRDYKNLLKAEYEKLKVGKINVNDFRIWIESCSEDLQYDRNMHFVNNQHDCNIAKLMDRLAIKLNYYDNYCECKDLIEKAVKEILI